MSSEVLVLEQKDFLNRKYKVELIPYKGRDFFKKVFVFPGQGASEPSMFKSYFDSLALGTFFKKADIEAKRLKISSLPSSYILDPQSIDPKDLPYTRNLALFTLQVGLFYSLLEKNIEPVCLTSHSFGEFASFVASGIVPFKSMFEIVSVRDRACPMPHKLGFMVAVNSKCEILRDLFQAELGKDVFISNENSAKQVALSCKPQFLESLKAKLKKKSIGFVLLEEVPQPYHTSLLQNSALKFREFLKELDFKVSKPEYPLFSSVTCDFLEEENLSKKKVVDILSQQLTQPVYFSKQITKLYEKGYSHFVEIGPKLLCSSFVKSVLKKEEHKVSLAESFFPKPQSKKDTSKVYSSEDSKVLKLIMKTVRAVTGYNIDEISIHSEFHKDLGVDSIKKAEIIFNVSESLNLKNESAGSMFSDVRQIEDVLSYIKQKKRLTKEERKVSFSPFKETFQPLEISPLDLRNQKPSCKIFVDIRDIVRNKEVTLDRVLRSLDEFLLFKKSESKCKKGELQEKKIGRQDVKRQEAQEEERLLFVLTSRKEDFKTTEESLKDFESSYNEITSPVVNFFSKVSQKIESLNLPLNLFFVCEKEAHPFVLSLDSFFKSLSYEQESCFYKNILFDKLDSNFDSHFKSKGPVNIEAANSNNLIFISNSGNNNESKIFPYVHEVVDNEFRDSFYTNILYEKQKRYVKEFKKTNSFKSGLESHKKSHSGKAKVLQENLKKNLKTAVFIGGSRGIGYVLAKALLKDMERIQEQKTQEKTQNSHFRLYILGRSPEEKVKENLKKLGGRVIYKQTDAQSKEALTKTLDEILAQEEKIDLLVNGSGHEDSERLRDKTQKDIEKEFNNKVKPALYLLEYFLKREGESAENERIGQILHHSSVVGEFGNDGQTIYSMANQLISYLSSQFNRFNKKQISKTFLWPAWDQVGMTEKSGILKKLKLSGVTALPSEKGEKLFLHEIFNFDEEKVIFLDEEHLKQYSGGLEKRKNQIPFETLLSVYDKVKLSDLSLENQDYLRDHTIQGKCIYPGASALALSTYAALTYFKKYPVLKKFEAENILIVPEKPSSLFLEGLYSKKKDTLRVEVSSSLRHFSSLFKERTNESLKEGFDFKEEGKLHAESLYKKSDIFGPRFRYKAPVLFDQSKRGLITLFEEKMWDYTGFRLFDLLQQWFELSFQTMSISLVWETGFIWIPQKVEEVIVDPEKLTSTLYAYTKHLKREESIASGTPCLFNEKKEIFMEIRGLQMKVFGKNIRSIEETFVKI